MPARRSVDYLMGCLPVDIAGLVNWNGQFSKMPKDKYSRCNKTRHDDRTAEPH